jgi:hypothetical protein
VAWCQLAAGTVNFVALLAEAVASLTVTALAVLVPLSASVALKKLAAWVRTNRNDSQYCHKTYSGSTVKAKKSGATGQHPHAYY